MSLCRGWCLRHYFLYIPQAKRNLWLRFLKTAVFNCAFVYLPKQNPWLDQYLATVCIQVNCILIRPSRFPVFNPLIHTFIGLFLYFNLCWDFHLVAFEINSIFTFVKRLLNTNHDLLCITLFFCYLIILKKYFLVPFAFIYISYTMSFMNW